MSPSENTKHSLSRRIYSVSEFSGSLSLELADKFPSVCVRGEVTNLSKPRSGHWYFSLKDEDAQIRAVMFRGSNLKAHQIKEGEEVIACGKPGIYKDRGDLQLIASHIQLAGAGDLQRQFEALKNQLQAQGYFDRDRKKSIPKHPSKVAVITSASGAVVHDIQTITSRRAPILPWVLLPTNVQGSEAIDSIVKAISIADQHRGIDLILLARGGGSMEDFAAFNSPQVARAIIDCQTPLISAVGHESDISIADLVADLRAATPSEAAEVISAGYATLADQLNRFRSALSQAMERQLSDRQNHLLLKSKQLLNPAQEISSAMQRLDSLEALMEGRIQLLQEQKNAQFLKISKSLNIKALSQKLTDQHYRLSVQMERLNNSQRASLQQARQQFSKTLQLLEAVSPLAVLGRGYSITSDTENRVISSIQQLSPGQCIRTRLEDGTITSEVVDGDGS